MVKVSDNPEVQAHYESMIAAGESHNIAKMCATRIVPSTVTDREFNVGRHNNNQFENCPGLGNYYKRLAEKAGVSVNGKYYVHGLGDYPGDPKAWCSGRGDVLARAKEKNLKLDGLVSYKGHEVEPSPDVPLAEDLWERDTHEYLAEHPGARYEDAKEKVFSVRTGREVINDALLVEDYVPHPADVIEADE